ncbi:MAG: sulfurtransferase TusA family protein [Spirochaetes bacterium]|nr:sulfurtransferase TusA family protein [Spirochaetota bacterium]
MKVVDCLNENCPIPLIKTRQAIMDGKKSDLIQVIGDHPQSFDEIPMALESMGIKIIEKKQGKDVWRIKFKL